MARKYVKHSRNLVSHKNLFLSFGIIAVSIASGIYIFKINDSSTSYGTSTNEQSSYTNETYLTVKDTPTYGQVTVDENSQQSVIYTNVTSGKLLESINKKRQAKGLAALSINEKLNKAAVEMMKDRTYYNDSNKFGELLNNVGYKYGYASANITIKVLNLYGEQDMINKMVQYLEKYDNNIGIYRAVYSDVGIHIANGNTPEAYVIWAQPYQSTASSNTNSANYNSSGGSSSLSNSYSGSSGSGSTFTLPEFKTTFDPLPDLDLNRPLPTFDVTPYLPSSGSCTSVTSGEPNKYYYKCRTGQKPSGIGCNAIAPYDYTSTLWSCLK